MLDVTAVNWLAVIVSAIVSFALGAVWYIAWSKPWMAYTGINMEEASAGGRGKMAGMYGAAFLSYLVAVIALALLVVGAGAANALDGLLLGLVVGVGVVAAVSFNIYMFSTRPFGLYLIDLGYPVLALAISGVILGAWR